MKYVFTNDDGSMSLELPEIVREGEFEAKAILNNVYQIEELYRLAIDSFKAYTHLTLISADDARYSFRVDHVESFVERVKVNQVLSSLFTVLRLYRDTIFRIFTKNAQVHHLFEMDGFKEIDALRNYMQHISLLPLRSTQKCELVREDVCFVQVRHVLDESSLRIDELSNQTSRRTLSEMLARGDLDIYEIVMVGLAAFNRIHEVIRETKYFGEIVETCAEYMSLLDKLSIQKGMKKFLVKDEAGNITSQGNVYFFLAQCRLISDIRTHYLTHHLYPIDKIHPNNLPDSFIQSFGDGYKIDWKVCEELHKEEDRLRAEYSLGGIEIDDGRKSFYQAFQLLKMVDSGMCKK